LNCAHFAPRFDVAFQVTPERVEVIATQQIQAGWDGIHAQVTLPPPSGLSRLEMVYDARLARATISVDDRVVIRDYTGTLEYREDLGVFFGMGSIDGTMASTVFGGLRFEILA
jgi:hypothetical protein